MQNGLKSNIGGWEGGEDFLVQVRITMQKRLKCKVHINRELRGSGRSLYKIEARSSPTYSVYQKGKEIR
jgi:hypothetical protein